MTNRIANPVSVLAGSPDALKQPHARFAWCYPDHLLHEYVAAS
jgi:hypothetical protein